MVTTICVSLHVLTVSGTPLNEIELDPRVAWKPEPFTVTCVPTTPLVGETLVTCGPGTLKSTLVLLPTPPTVTCTAPVVAVEGTVATICVSDQLVMVVAVALEKNLSVLVACVAPKP